MGDAAELYRLKGRHYVPSPRGGQVALEEGDVARFGPTTAAAIGHKLEPVPEDYDGPVAWDCEEHDAEMAALQEEAKEVAREAAESRLGGPLLEEQEYDEGSEDEYEGESELVVEQPSLVELPFDPGTYAVSKKPYQGPLARALGGIEDPEVVQALQRVDTRKTAAAVYEWRLDQLAG